MRSQTLILASLPLLVRAVDILLYSAMQEDPILDCTSNHNGAYIMCSEIPADTCCQAFWQWKVNTVAARGLNSSQENGRFPDTLSILNGDDANPCSQECGGSGGFDKPCLIANDQCLVDRNGGSKWHDGDNHPKGRLAKRAVKVVNPNVAGFWDTAGNKHRTFNIGSDVPTEVAQALVNAANSNVKYEDLDESIKAFEILS